MQAASEKFSSTAIVLHWAIAAGMALAAAYGLISDYASDAETTRSTLVLHESIGMLVLALAVARLAWRLTHKPPPLPDGMPLNQRVAAAITHVTLYVMIFALPITGYIGLAARGRPLTMFGLFDLPRLVPRSLKLSATVQNIHDYGQYPLYALVIFHVGAALYHQYVVKDGIMGRMWWGRKAKAESL